MVNERGTWSLQRQDDTTHPFTDNRPQTKPHFAAIQPPPPKLAPAVLQAESILAAKTVVTTNAAPRPSRGPRPSRVPRVSGIGAGPLPLLAKTRSRPPFSAAIEEESTVQLTDKDIDERVCFLFRMPSGTKRTPCCRLQGL